MTMKAGPEPSSTPISSTCSMKNLCGMGQSELCSSSYPITCIVQGPFHTLHAFISCFILHLMWQMGGEADAASQDGNEADGCAYIGGP